MISLLLPLLLALPSDQAAAISETQARKGAEIIRQAGQVAWLCEPCGETRCEVEEVASSVSVPSGIYHEVRVNGKEADLAYVFVPRKGKWTNVAKLMGLPVHDVSRTLPETLCPRKLLARPSAPTSPPIPGAPATIDRFEGDFTVPSLGASRLALALLESSRKDGGRATGSTWSLDIRFHPRSQDHFPEGGQLALPYSTDPANPHVPYRILYLELFENDQIDGSFCRRDECSLQGRYLLGGCRQLTKSIDQCGLSRIPMRRQ